MVADVVSCAGPVVLIIGPFQSAATGYDQLCGRAPYTVTMGQSAMTFCVKHKRHNIPGIISHSLGVAWKLEGISMSQAVAKFESCLPHSKPVVSQASMHTIKMQCPG